MLVFGPIICQLYTNSLGPAVSTGHMHKGFVVGRPGFDIVIQGFQTKKKKKTSGEKEKKSWRVHRTACTISRILTDCTFLPLNALK